MAKRTEQAVACCGAAFHEITVQGAGASLSLSRCTGCDRQQWTCDGVAVPRDTALERLASTFGKAPAPRAQVADAAAAARRTARRDAKLSTTEAPAATPDVAPELVDLLQGWQVLGASR